MEGTLCLLGGHQRVAVAVVRTLGKAPFFFLSDQIIRFELNEPWQLSYDPDIKLSTELCVFWWNHSWLRSHVRPLLCLSTFCLPAAARVLLGAQ